MTYLSYSQENMADNKVVLPCVVADSAAFLKNVDLERIAEKIYTITDVVNEIRDASTKQRLSVLPYELMFKEPAVESLKFVSDFAKKTGDFKSLSAVDLKVLALTHHLEKEFCDPSHVKDEPNKKVQLVSRSKISCDKEMAGFYLENKIHKKHSDDTDNAAESIDSKQNVNLENMIVESNEEIMELEIDEVNSKNRADGNNQIDMNGSDEGYIENCEDDIDSNIVNDVDDNENNEGWITPSNIKSMKEKMGYNDETDISLGKIKCACLTTDFAMQNVLIQMGLHVVSVNGMMIKQARNYVQKCFGCYKETSSMEKIFCPGCGNKTLMKVAVTVADDGTMQYHYPKRRRNFNIRGTKYSAPAPKGGRQSADQPILVEDQRSMSNRLPKKQDNINPLDPDYITRTSPFGMKDTNSRAFALGHYTKNNQRRNPNENKKKKSGRKK